MGNELHAQFYAAAFKNCVLTHVEQTYPYSIGEKESLRECRDIAETGDLLFQQKVLDFPLLPLLLLLSKKWLFIAPFSCVCSFGS